MKQGGLLISLVILQSGRVTYKTCIKPFFQYLLMHKPKIILSIAYSMGRCGGWNNNRVQKIISAKRRQIASFKNYHNT